MGSIATQWGFSKRCQEGIPILMFHKIGKCPASAKLPQLYVSPVHFQKLLDGFKRKNLRSISISDAVHPKTPIGDRFVISFDDGYEGSLISAAEAMRGHGFTAIQFLVANRLGQRNDWDLGLSR
jgi:peptidoglycan/xylan/chitin deacetylase (PgdA/CDA1 family)